MIQRAVFGLGLLALAPGAALAQSATGPETLEIFNAVCLERLPKLEGVGDGFVEAGLVRTPDGFWADDARGLIGGLMRYQNDRQRACMLALEGADMAGLNGVLGTALGNAMGEAQVGVIRGPMPGDSSLYMVDRGDYRVTAVVAEVSEGYGMLSVSVDVAEDGTPPWTTP